MKTIEQTNRYLSSCIFDDDSWEQVLVFCREQYGGGKVHRPRRGQYHVTLSDFLVWFKYMPGQGDVVAIGNVIGMVGKCSPSVYTICAYTGQDGQLISNDMEVLPHRVRLAGREETVLFHNMLFNANVSYSVRLGKLVDLYIPDNGDFVLVKHSGTIRYGIFDRVDSSGYLFYYLDGKDGKVVNTAVPVAECEVEPVTPKQGLELLERLSQNGLMWSPADKRLSPVPMKVDFGGKYWYVNDKFYVCQAKDMQTPVHKERYRNGNYFTSYAEALVFLDKMKKIRIEMNKGLDR